MGAAESFDCRCGEVATTNEGENRLAAMDFRFLPAVGMTGRGLGMTTPSTGLRMGLRRVVRPAHDGPFDGLRIEGGWVEGGVDAAFGESERT